MYAIFQKSDQVATFPRFGYAELHVVSGDEGIGVGEPAFERHVVPGDVCLFDRGGVVKARYRTGNAPKNPAQTRAFAVLVQRVTSGTAALEDVFAADSATFGGHLHDL